VISTRKSILHALTISLSIFFGSCTGDPQKAKAKYFAEGQKYLKNGQYGDARVEFRNALRLDPRFVDAYYQLAQADLARHDWREAYLSLQKAIELDPARLDARLDRGRLYLAARQFKDAEDEANFILQRQSNDVGAYQLLGAALIGEQKPDKSLAAFGKVTELRPNDPSAYINTALVEINLHHFSDAEQHLKKALLVDPKSTEAYKDLANFYRLQNRASDAEQVFQHGIAQNPEAIALYVAWAAMLSAQGQDDKATALLDKLRNQLPKSSAAAQVIGDYHFQRKDTDRALAEYRRGLSIAPRDLEIKKRVQDLYLATGQLQLAADLDKELLKSAPKDVFVRIDHGRLLMAQGKLQDGTIYLQSVVADAAGSAEPHYYLALAYWQEGSLGQANSELQEALNLSPGMPVALASLAQLNVVQNRLLEAQHDATELVQKHPEEVSYRLLLANIYLRSGQLPKAEEQCLAALQLRPNQGSVHLNLGQIYSAEEKWSNADTEFEAALRLEPNNAGVLSYYANSFLARQQIPKAMARVQQYIDANQNDSQGHVILGILQFNAKNISSAQAEFQKALQLDSKNVQAHLGMGEAYRETSQTDAAIGQYQQVLDLQPKSAPLVTMVGNLYLERNDLDAARKYYLRAIELDPNYAVAMANLAWVDAQESKNLDVALGRAQKAKSMMPEVPAITDTLAWVMYKKGNYSGAIPLLQDCVKKSPDSAQFHFHLGLALVGAGQKDLGKGQLNAALQTNRLNTSDSKQAQDTLGELK
jgi:tetratricopeptide (TPR) repeat protein